MQASGAEGEEPRRSGRALKPSRKAQENSGMIPLPEILQASKRARRATMADSDACEKPRFRQVAATQRDQPLHARNAVQTAAAAPHTPDPGLGSNSENLPKTPDSEPSAAPAGGNSDVIQVQAIGPASDGSRDPPTGSGTPEKAKDANFAVETAGTPRDTRSEQGCSGERSNITSVAPGDDDDLQPKEPLPLADSPICQSSSKKSACNKTSTAQGSKEDKRPKMSQAVYTAFDSYVQQNGKVTVANLATEAANALWNKVLEAQSDHERKATSNAGGLAYLHGLDGSAQKAFMDQQFKRAWNKMFPRPSEGDAEGATSNKESSEPAGGSR